MLLISEEEQQKICHKAIMTFGENTQMVKTMEECGELIRALSRVVIDQDADIKNVCEEIADLEIMLMQLRNIFPNVSIDDWKYKKFKRLKGVVW